MNLTNRTLSPAQRLPPASWQRRKKQENPPPTPEHDGTGHHDHSSQGSLGRPTATPERAVAPAAPIHEGRPGSAPPCNSRCSRQRTAEQAGPHSGGNRTARQQRHAAATQQQADRREQRQRPRTETSQAPDLRQRKQRVSAGFSCVSFFWRGLRRTVAFVAGAGAPPVYWRT